MDPATLCKELERQVENRRIIAGYIKLAEQQHSHDEQELQAARRARRDRIRPQQRRELLGR
jgi:hypothetical protein